MADNSIYLIVRLKDSRIHVRSSEREANRDAERLAKQDGKEAYYVAEVRMRYLPLKNGDVACKVY